MNGPAILDFLRGIFIYVLAVALPLAGAVVAISEFSRGNRDEGTRLLVATLLGVFVYLLILS